MRIPQVLVASVLVTALAVGTVSAPASAVSSTPKSMTTETAEANLTLENTSSSPPTLPGTMASILVPIASLLKTDATKSSSVSWSTSTYKARHTFYPLTISADVSNPEKRKGYLQRKVNGKWKNVATRQFKDTSGWERVTFTIKEPRFDAGTYYYRVRVPAKTGVKEAVSQTRKFVSTKSAYHDPKPNNRLLTAYKKKRTKIPVEVYPAAGGTVKLQRYHKGKWRTVSKKTIPRNYKTKTVWINTARTKKAKTKYRIILPKTAVTNKKTSKTFTVYTVKKHKKYTKKIRNYVSKYCKSSSKVPIYVNHPRMPKHLAGQAYGPENVILIKGGMSASNQRYVGRHECAHILQFKHYRQGTIGKYNKKIGSLYKGNAFEKAADCMTAAWNGSRFSGGHYTSKCSKKQYSHAKNALKSLGNKKKPYWIYRK